jgi:hypothetical protein
MCDEIAQAILARDGAQSIRENDSAGHHPGRITFY